MFCNYFPLLLGLLSALIGGFIGWQLLKNSRLAPVLGVVDEKDSHIEGLQSDLSTQKIHYTRLRNDHESLTSSLADWKGKFGNVSTELATLGAAKLALDADFSKYKAHSETTIVGLEGQLRDWKQKFQNLETAQKTLQSELESTRRDRDAKIAEADAQLKTANAKIVEINAAHQSTVTDWTSRYGKLETEYKGLQSNVQHLETEKTNLATDFDLKKRQFTEGASEEETKAKELENQLVSLRNNLQILENDKSRLATDIQNLTTEKTRLATDFDNEKSRLKTDAHRLKTENEGISARLQVKERELTEGVVQWQSRYSTLDGQLNSLRLERDDLTGKLHDGQRRIEAAARDSEQRAFELDKEIKRLRDELSKKPAGVVLRDAAEVEAEHRSILERIRQKSASGGLKAFGAWGGGKGDNLKKLRGINPFIEKKMNAAGIYSYRQVAYLSGEDQNELNSALELSKNKFQKEEWVFQAKRLIGLISDESPDVLLARIHGRMSELNFD